MLSYRDVSKRYGDVIALKGVTLEFQPGKIHALLGPNGSGKSTLMKIALGLVKPDSGSVRVYDVDPVRDPIGARRLIGYVPEEVLIYESLTPSEWFSFVGSIYGMDRELLRERLDTLIRVFKMEEHMGKLGGELSLGNKRKVMLITALMKEPKVLILDEPFSGLDPEVARVLKEILRRKAEEGVVIFSTHILELAEAVADDITILRYGEVVARGPISELRGKKDLESYFMEVTGLSSELQELLKAL
ncbi:ABC transporter ATP-binding protein [Candidatus Korarchaeum cryptofilum]|uniref:ABC transporter related n=1 Tax=Korarchaeum cryptofilum (strain OPF8) TaxID=374847 RepID=B1L509_KORCO|nr:ABC transporter ATP-binding protein [Candidatus Korarchaeum cryptofilum]ACB07538.1 ABC transporter related [Candidatus Korarchaeum cryptofilum OPF8]